MTGNIDSAAGQVGSAELEQWLPRLGWPAQVTAIWAAAGGVAGGGLAVLLLLLGRMHPDGSMLVALILGTIGGMLGALHGGVLGFLGRQADTDSPARLRDRILALVAAAAALLTALLVPVWLVMSAVLLRSGSLWGGVALLAGTAPALAIVAWATVLGWRSLERVRTRWPQRRLAAALAGGAFTLLSLVLLGVRPAIPGTQLELSAFSWVVVAAFATLWLITPLIGLGLRWGEASSHRPVPDQRGGRSSAAAP
jgi:hypothetical protein